MDQDYCPFSGRKCANFCRFRRGEDCLLAAAAEKIAGAGNEADTAAEVAAVTGSAAGTVVPTTTKRRRCRPRKAVATNETA
jgi:hypothetical protein